MVFSFYALIYFLPISIALSEMFTGIALGFYIFKRSAVLIGRFKEKQAGGVASSWKDMVFTTIKAYKPVDSSLNKPILLLLIFSLISVFVSPFKMLSWSGFLGKVLQSAFLYFNFIECINTKKRLKTFVTVFFVSYLLICVNGIYQSIVGYGFIHGHVIQARVLSSFRTANDFAAYLIIVIPILFDLTFLTASRNCVLNEKGYAFFSLNFKVQRTITFFLFAMGLLCLGLTFSRGAWVGFILAMGAMSFVGFSKRKKIVAHCLLIVLFLLIFYPGTIINKNIRIPFRSASEPVQFNPEVTGEALNVKTKEEKEYVRFMVGSRFSIINPQTFAVQNNRLGYWKKSLEIIRNYPLFGCGLNAYAMVEGSYNVGWGGYPHNSYFQMAAETGLFGLMTFLWLLFVLFRDALRAFRKIENENDKKFFIGILTGLLGFLIHSFFDTNFYSVQLGSLMWILMGVIMAFMKIERSESTG